MNTIKRHLKLTASITCLFTASLLACSGGDLTVDNLEVTTNALVQGSLGVGTTNAQAKLHVIGGGGDILKVVGAAGYNISGSFQNTGGGNPQLRFLNAAGAERFAFTLLNTNESGGRGLGAFWDGTENLMSVGLGGVTIGHSYYQLPRPSGGLIVEGNVGIGVTAPTNKLQVAGNVSFSGTLKSGPITSTGSISGTALNGTSAYINNGSGFASFAFYGGSGGVFQNGAYSFTIDQQAAAPIFFRTDSGTYRMTIAHGSGNVGIGTTSPSERLHVSGNVKVTSGQFIGNGSGLLISAQGDLSMGTFTAGTPP